MATLNNTTRQANAYTANVNTLSASDTLVYTPRKNQMLELRNTTASPVPVTIDGSTASAAFPVPGAGSTTVDLSAGKTINVPAGIGATVMVPLDNMQNYLQGTILVTGGVGVTAIVYTD